MDVEDRAEAEDGGEEADVADGQTENLANLTSFRAGCFFLLRLDKSLTGRC